MRNIILRSACSAALLAYLVYKTDFTPLRETLLGFRPWFYLLAIIGVCVYQYLYGLILKILLSTKGNKVGAFEIFRLLIISIFFGTFLPGGAGPDIILAYNLSRSTPRKEDALSALIFTRMMTLFVMLLAASIFSMLPGVSVPYIRNLTLMLLSIFLLFYFTISSARGLRLSQKLFSRYRWATLFHQTHCAVSSYGKNKVILLTVFLMSILAVSSKVVIDYIIALSLGLDIRLIYFFIFVPLVSIVTIIPVSISGIGVREGAYVKLLSTIGLAPANSFSISILSFSLSLWFCIAGAIIYTIKGNTLKIK